MAERKSRRVRTEPVPGSDPTPQLPKRVERAAEDDEKTWGDRDSGNDEQLRRDVPPHY
ncbi:hypothetical protein [Herbiconiux sp. L3-i23]|jgi:hypothetical protein|uniref:hypothetical protein n=1 Tax=Herbiconiux sp. L3-i23 TaxID=2905871 RepID=UPI002061D2A4|nr:hypothetical protein [Herbiconiux sp. L3-i23]BDI23679.1 hypothetical protein L3i23_24550 [Herbiconiux sp. L3-i23]